MLKTLILSVRNGGFSLKKRRFLKLIRLVVYIKTFYLSDNQYFLCNAKNKRFSSSKAQCAGKYRIYVWLEQPFC